MQVFDNNENIVNFVDDENIFNFLDKDEQFLENIDFEDDRGISNVLLEKLKFNSDDNDGLM